MQFPFVNRFTPIQETGGADSDRVPDRRRARHPIDQQAKVECQAGHRQSYRFVEELNLSASILGTLKDDKAFPHRPHKF